MKPNCYGCIYRRPVPGSTHSCCVHPAVWDIVKDPLCQILGILAGAGRITANTGETVIRGCGKGNLRIEASPVGVRKGWFNFPINFDPIWLRSCDGFTRKKEKNGGKNDG